MISASPDNLLRWVVLFGASIAAGLLALSITMRMRRTPPGLTRGQLRAQSGFFLMLVSPAYGVCENLFGAYHLRLWIFALGSLWSLVGCYGLLMDALDERYGQLKEEK